MVSLLKPLLALTPNCRPPCLCLTTTSTSWFLCYVGFRLTKIRLPVILTISKGEVPVIELYWSCRDAGAQTSTTADPKLLFWFLFLPVEAIVEFDYQAQHDDELTISVGEVITNIRKEDGGWWEGQINGRRGLFPDNFVRVSTKPNPFSCFLCGLCRPKGCGGGVRIKCTGLLGLSVAA